jgi:hypothetical protein
MKFNIIFIFIFSYALFDDFNIVNKIENSKIKDKNISTLIPNRTLYLYDKAFIPLSETQNYTGYVCYKISNTNKWYKIYFDDEDVKEINITSNNALQNTNFEIRWDSNNIDCNDMINKSNSENNFSIIGNFYFDNKIYPNEFNLSIYNLKEYNNSIKLKIDENEYDCNFNGGECKLELNLFDGCYNIYLEDNNWTKIDENDTGIERFKKLDSVLCVGKGGIRIYR